MPGPVVAAGRVRHPWRPAVILHPVGVMDAITESLHAMGLAFESLGELGRDHRWRDAGRALNRAATELRALRAGASLVGADELAMWRRRSR